MVVLLVREAGSNCCSPKGDDGDGDGDDDHDDEDDEDDGDDAVHVSVKRSSCHSYHSQK